MFTGYIQKIRESAIASVPEKDKASLQYLMGEVKSIDLSKLPKAKGPGVAWTVDSALKMLNKEPLSGRSYANGRENVLRRTLRSLSPLRQGRRGHRARLDQPGQAQRLQVDPRIDFAANLVVSDQFEQHELTMKDGSLVLGRIVIDDKDEYGLVQSGLEPLKIKKVKKSEVASKKGSKISMMPGGLINSMNEEEVKDLIAYFVSGGDRKHKVYRSGKKLEIELISALYGEDGNPKKQMDVRKVIQKQLDAWQYDFAITNKLAGRDPAGGIFKVLHLTYKHKGRPSPRKSKRTESSRSTNNLSRRVTASRPIFQVRRNP